MTEAPKSEATVGQLLSSLASDTGALVRQEVELAATEITERAKSGARSAGFIFAGGALIQVACVAAVLALMTGLDPKVPPWATAAGLCLLFVGLGVILLVSGIKTLEHLGTKPSATVSTLRDDGAWVKEQLP